MRAFIVSPEDTSRFQEVDRPAPGPGPRDLLVRVQAVSLNPVDTKVRPGRAGRVLGWDAAGVVEAIGPEVKFYRPGDEVYYAGDLRREGCNAELQAVDERLVGRRPRSLGPAEAATVPLTALTAWEGLYEQLQVHEGRTLLVINSAGGVGSMVLQLAKRVSRMMVIGTASREESAAWSRRLGADQVVDHRQDLPAQVQALGRESVDYIFCCHGTAEHFAAMAGLIAPQGRIVSIVESKEPLPMTQLMTKRAGFFWEFMFSKPMYQTADMASQREILDRVADLIDTGVLTPALRGHAGRISAEALTHAHHEQASGTMIGKLALVF